MVTLMDRFAASRTDARLDLSWVPLPLGQRFPCPVAVTGAAAALVLDYDDPTPRTRLTRCAALLRACRVALLRPDRGAFQPAAFSVWYTWNGRPHGVALVADWEVAPAARTVTVVIDRAPSEDVA